MKYPAFILAFIVSCFSGLIGCGKPFSGQSSSTKEVSSFWSRSWTPSSSDMQASQQPFQGSVGQNIAILLPFKGIHAKAAYAILDGFLAAYYQDSQGRFPGASVRVYDTSHNNAANLYLKAVADGANFVVGPLTKKEVQTVAQLRSLPIPVLALNSVTQFRDSEPLFQFGLVPEEETGALAQRAFRAGHKQALILVPKNEWGQRMNTAFRKAWLHEGGIITATYWAEAGPELASQLKTFLQVNDRRARELGKVRAGTLKGSDPRRRHDFDVIILATSPELARQIRPLLNFYYAGHLPIYGTSSIYAGLTNPAKDLDLNGIIFSDMPGILDKQQASPELLQAFQSLWPNQASSAIRLFMMGMDAYELTRALPSLQTGNNTLNGRSGVLRVDEEHRLQRKLSWAQFHGGQPEMLYEDSHEQP